MILQKKSLSLGDLDAQTAIELPDRQMLALVNVVVTNIANNLSISIPVQNNHVGVEVCAAVTAINTILAPTSLTCNVAA